jgi:hypothetical protein
VTAVQSAEPKDGSRRPPRLLSVGAGLVAASALAGAIGLAAIGLGTAAAGHRWLSGVFHRNQH